MDRAPYYTLDDDHNPIPCSDVLEWGRWFEDFRNRCVGSTHIGPARVSTVFMGLDHQFGDGPPLLFETMVFDGAGKGSEELGDLTDRCSTWDEAVAMHERTCDRVIVMVREAEQAAAVALP